MGARELSAKDAIALVRPTDTLGLGLITSTPAGLLKEMSKRTDWEDLTVSSGLTLGNYEMFTHPGVHLRASFYGGGERAYKAKGGDVQFIPSFFRHYNLLIQHLKPRVMMMIVTMPDKNGRVNLSLYNGAHREEFLAAGRDPNRILIVECSPHYPRTMALEGFSNDISVDDIDVIVVSDEKPPIFPNDAGTPEDAMIAEHAAKFVQDGSTLQTGIGAVPNLVAQALVRGSGGDYGVHSEMFTDGLLELIISGKVTKQCMTL